MARPSGTSIATAVTVPPTYQPKRSISVSRMSALPASDGDEIPIPIMPMIVTTIAATTTAIRRPWYSISATGVVAAWLEDRREVEAGQGDADRAVEPRALLLE